MVAIGWAEGLSHVNLRKVYIITWWWFGSLIPICLITAALMAQGMAKSRWCVHVCVEVGVRLLVCVCVCLCVLVSKCTAQRTTTEPDKDTSADSSKGPCSSQQNTTLAVHQTVWVGS